MKMRKYLDMNKTEGETFCLAILELEGPELDPCLKQKSQTKYMKQGFLTHWYQQQKNKDLIEINEVSPYVSQFIALRKPPGSSIGRRNQVESGEILKLKRERWESKETGAGSVHKVELEERELHRNFWVSVNGPLLPQDIQQSTDGHITWGNM